jgi:hypothetical protein
MILHLLGCGEELPQFFAVDDLVPQQREVGVNRERDREDSGVRKAECIDDLFSQAAH